MNEKEINEAIKRIDSAICSLNAVGTVHRQLLQDIITLNNFKNFAFANLEQKKEGLNGNN